MHCVLCKSLVFDCVAAQPCEHKYCRECISRFQDCPLCGRDIDNVETDAACQGTVNDFINRHAHQEVPNGHSNGPVSEVQTPAAFFLDLGLTSLAGRNYSAALARLDRCRQLLLEQGDADRPSVKLGAVCGSQGDCSMQLGQMQDAAAHYRESIDHLSQAPEPNTEAQQALTVSLNKLGDLAYWQGDVQAARDTYHKALMVRQKLLEASQADDSSTEHAGLAVDVAVSLGKLMDADKVLEAVGC
ncbi:hypothetical protein WJX73_010362 [Symbiochloris irregularis]|uniref:RING-type domain-containing protein n=1 Tax=Symbiochloris irregularis TaxID=706552 RepID=A0AAW1NXN8_9CHLO